MEKQRKPNSEDYDSLITSDSNLGETFLTDLLPGNKYKIGKPSKDHYQYIHSHIVTCNQNDRPSNDLEKVKGAPVKVSSIITMKDGCRIAVLRPLDTEFFMESLPKLYARIDKATASSEIITLDV